MVAIPTLPRPCFYILDDAGSRDVAILNQLGLTLAPILETLLHTDHVTGAKPRRIAEVAPANLRGEAD